MSSGIITQSLAITSDALARAAVIAFQAAWTAKGLVKLTGIGEINTTTATRPTAVASRQPTRMGADMWAFADALQTAYPIFILTEYYAMGGWNGSGNSDNSRLGIFWTVGFSHTNLVLDSYNVSERRGLEPAAKNAASDNSPNTGCLDATFATITQHHCSGDVDRLTMQWGINAPLVFNGGTNFNMLTDTGEDGAANTFCDNRPITQAGGTIFNMYSGFLTIERTRNADGTTNGDGANIAHLGASGFGWTNGNMWNGFHGKNAFYSHYLPRTGSHQPQYIWPTINGGPKTSMMIGAAKGVAPIFTMLGGQMQFPVIGLVGCMDTDFEFGTNDKVEMYGALHTYYKSIQPNRGVFGKNWASSRIMVLAE